MLWCVSWLALLQAGPIERTGAFANVHLRESSGVAVSRAYPSVLWTHEDSGDRPYLYATDLAGRDLGRLLVAGANAEDWEDMALGDCPRRPGTSCLFIADTGDNEEDRPRVTVYAVPEPRPPGRAGDTLRVTAAARALHFRYERGPRDVEALFVERDGDMHLVTKGRKGTVEHYVVSAGAWDLAGPAVARHVQDLPIRSRAALGRWVTGAALSPSGGIAAVRTYSEVYLFPLEAGRLGGSPTAVCSVAAAEPQGEAVAFLDEATLVLTSEAGLRGRAPIHRLRCGAP